MAKHVREDLGGRFAQEWADQWARMMATIRSYGCALRGGADEQAVASWAHATAVMALRVVDVEAEWRVLLPDLHDPPFPDMDEASLAQRGAALAAGELRDPIFCAGRTPEVMDALIAERVAAVQRAALAHLDSLDPAAAGA